MTCGLRPTALRPDALIAVGFGAAGVTRDGLEIWSDVGVEIDDCRTVQDAEDEALKNPDYDWRVFFCGPLSDAEYQRRGAGHWVLIKQGPGFA